MRQNGPGRPQRTAKGRPRNRRRNRFTTHCFSDAHKVSLGVCFLSYLGKWEYNKYKHNGINKIAWCWLLGVRQVYVWTVCPNEMCRASGTTGGISAHCQLVRSLVFRERRREPWALKEELGVGHRSVELAYSVCWPETAHSWTGRRHSGLVFIS